MRVIIAGSRSINDIGHINEAIQKSQFQIEEVVSGTCKGPDLLGEMWAWFSGIPIKQFPANWGIHGKKAGMLRNVEMAEYADALIAVWDGESKGTANMIKQMKTRNKPFYIHEVKE